MHNGVTIKCGSASVCSPAIFKTSFSYDKDVWIAATDYHNNYAFLHNYAVSIDSSSPINPFATIYDD